MPLRRLQTFSRESTRAPLLRRDETHSPLDPDPIGLHVDIFEARYYKKTKQNKSTKVKIKSNKTDPIRRTPDRDRCLSPDWRRTSATVPPNRTYDHTAQHD